MLGLLSLRRMSRVFLLLWVAAWLPAGGPVLADHGEDPDLGAVDYVQNLNQPVPQELPFVDETGRSVRLGDYLGQKPAILVFAYYECPMLCTLVLNELTRSLQDISLIPGEDFEVITVSIDPRETPELAAEKKVAYLEAYGNPEAARGWHFLTGEAESIASLAAAAGFEYQYDPKIDQYAHPTGIVILTPQGKISRYILGIDYPARDVRLGLVEAGGNKIGSPVDQFFLLCYHYDPTTGRYTLAVQNILRIAGSLTALALGGLLFVLFRRENNTGPEHRPGSMSDKPDG